jgi:tungstate transport system substrate-binding protein
MYNYFVIIGPENDPAGIKNASNATNAFTRIAAKQSPFVSRGDNSGTHIMELSIWKAANIIPVGTWYQSVGKGMGKDGRQDTQSHLEDTPKKVSKE